jgi:hypothetical protein
MIRAAGKISIGKFLLPGTARHSTNSRDDIFTGGVFTWLIINPLRKEVVRPKLNVCVTE